MPAARREVVISVQDGGAVRGEEAARRERAKDGVEEGRVPAIEKIAGDGQVIGTFRGDAIELALQPDHIAVISQVQIRQMRDQQSVKS